MKFLDLFAGIGGIRLGMEQAGHSCVGWVEWDKFARKSYQAIHIPDGEFTEKDINDVKAELLPKSDCWCFGFPCQDISVAGKQGGFTNGKRSSLFFKVTGLIRELKEEDKPSYLFIENVKNLLSINKGWDFAKLLIEMDEIGYDVEWDVLDSAEVVPQHRERIFIIGHLRKRRTRKVFPIIIQGGQTASTNEINDLQKIAVHQVCNISDSSSFGGNPQVGRVYATDGIAPTLNTMQGGGREPKVVIPVLTPDRINKRQNGRRFKENGDQMFTIDTVDRRGIAINDGIVPKKEFGRLGRQAVETMNTHGAKDGDIIEPFNYRVHENGIAPTITTRPEGLKTAILPVTNGLRIRKLTPRECWRLQGFPDWAFDKAKGAGISNSQLYKQAGNSVTVPVIKAIAERMELEDKL